MVRMKRLTDKEIAACGEWQGKAGAHIDGSHTAIVGLPLSETKSLLEGMGWRG